MVAPNPSGIEPTMKTVSEVLQQLPHKFQPDAAADLSVVFQFIIDDSRHFFLTIKDRQCQVNEQEHPDPDVTLIMESQTFIDVISGSLGGTSAYMSGRLRAEGNIMLATKLSRLFKR
jgi:putative sterol carrier protein